MIVAETITIIATAAIIYIVIAIGVADIYKDVMLYPKNWYERKTRVVTKAFVAVMIIVGSTWIIWVFPFMLFYCLKLCYMKTRDWIKYFMNLPNSEK